ncbi:hypothetical protein [Kallotenue papyrolyticum]|uniref:hypothetical protein n=1 Tax=Kallotenue papyrolyticum TaxID=1325125 RepID=UPI000492552A|nr:hypothetical protein [Kallotenue papyrolyticum]
MAERKMLREIMSLNDIYTYAESISEMLREMYGGYDADVFDEVMVDEAFARRLAARGYEVRPWQPEPAARPAGETVPVVVIRRPATAGGSRPASAPARTSVTRGRAGLPLRPSSAAPSASSLLAPEEAPGDSRLREAGASEALLPASEPTAAQAARGAPPAAQNGTPTEPEPAGAMPAAASGETAAQQGTTTGRRTRTARATTGAADSSTGTTRVRRTRTSSEASSEASSSAAPDAAPEESGATRTRRTRTRRSTQPDAEDV